MRIFIPRETHSGEQRVPMIPGDVGKLVERGAEVVVESGMGT
ncbi:MAG: NAD(P)(+) transhydrogenase (Re/Si-specific) subunit alpha, partial [Candidatus Hydrogenedentes bacterium]|nr:NAD(P)(+) transhydrogenase (Re/Si-specific) subunit alpha [Candidatus Hydrogenedentota bacterium]